MIENPPTARRATKAEQVIFLQTQIRAAQQRVDRLSDQLVRVISSEPRA
jgi:hypothetical protein